VASARRKIAKGLNPIDERRRDGGIPTFGNMADDVRASLSMGFRNEKHKAQWKSTLETYAAPLRAKPVDTIATDDVLAVLKPIWTKYTARPAGRHGLRDSSAYSVGLAHRSCRSFILFVGHPALRS
jgi:hypothetical protein